MSISVQTEDQRAMAASPDAQRGNVPDQAGANAQRDERQSLGRQARARRRARHSHAKLYGVGLVGSLLTLLLAFPAADQSTPHLQLLYMTPFVGGAAIAACLQALAYWTYAHSKHVTLGATLSISAFIVLLGWSSLHTGGVQSSLVVLLLLVPVEALLTGNKRTALAVAGVSGTVFLSATLMVNASVQTYSIPDHAHMAMMVFACVYAFSLAVQLIQLTKLRNVRVSANQRAIDQFHAVTHDVFVILQRDGSVERVFGAVGSVLGCAKADLKGSGLIQRMHLADRPQFLTAVDQVHMSQKRASADVRLRMGPEGGAQHFIWTEIDLSAITGLNGEREVYALVRDISAVKEHAAALMLAREKAEANDAAKGRFLATMSHELRTPLNAIIGFADILDEEVFGQLANEQQREYVGLIRESGGHLLQLVNDLLDMSKLEAGHFHIVAEPFAVHTIVERCTRLMCQQIAKAEQTLKVDVQEGLAELNADPRAFRQILINLLSNACKFTPQGGSITLRARRDGAMLVLSIADTGIGISPQDLKQIGQPFFQADGAYNREHQGTGLGLSVVKGLCELHEGRLTITSVEGEGTTVTVRLPMAGPSSDGLEAAHGDAHNRATNATVLAKLEQTSPLSKAEQGLSAPDPAGDLEQWIADQEGQDDKQERLRAHG